MKIFLVGESFLNVNKQELEVLLENLYYENYGKDRLKHLSNDDPRLPDLKITDDLVSFNIYFKDKSKKEHKVIVDGNIFLNEIKLHTFTFENFELNKLEEESYIKIIKRITEVSEGYVMVSINNKPYRIMNGKIDNEKTLLNELFEKIPNESKQEVKVVFDWLIDCSKGTV